MFKHRASRSADARILPHPNHAPGIAAVEMYRSNNETYPTTITAGNSITDPLGNIYLNMYGGLSDEQNLVGSDDLTEEDEVLLASLVGENARRWSPYDTNAPSVERLRELAQKVTFVCWWLLGLEEAIRK